MDNHETFIGKLLDGRYRVQSVVGTGGMSVVLKAVDTADGGKAVTIKMLNESSLRDSTAVERFTNEAKAVELLDHPNIVSVHNVSLGGENKYIVMEYIDGITLKEYLDKKKRLEWREAVHYTVQILSALSHAHGKGVVHRDIKPENVMLMRDGSIKVIDFGIAKLPDSKSLTVIDKAIGTVNYISPEQASGQGSTDKSDIYSTGILLYELVTGKLPFVSGSSVSVAMMHVSSEPAMPTSLCEDIPKGLEQIIIKAMMKSPERRFGSANAMKKAIEFLIENPEAIFREKVVIGADGKPITGTGASQNAHINNSVISDAVGDDDDDDDDEGVRPAFLPIVLGIFLAFCIASVVFLMLAVSKLDIANMFNVQGEDITIPDLRGEVWSESLEEKHKENFNFEESLAYNDKVPEGQIISQHPRHNLAMKKTKDPITIKVVVSRGRSQIVLDDYSIVKYGTAKVSLDNKKLKHKVEYENNETVIKDYVIRTDPEPGTIMNPDDVVTLYVSKGPVEVKVRMPDVRGYNLSDAEDILRAKDISVDIERVPNGNYPPNTVYSMSISPGKKVTANKTTVKLLVSVAPEPEPEPEASPT